MEIIKGINVAVRFLLELCALGALGYWGFQTGSTAITKAGLGIGAPLVAAVVWGMMVAPQASISTPDVVRLGLELCVFGAAVAALVVSGRSEIAWILAVVYVVNQALMVVWGQ